MIDSQPNECPPGASALPDDVARALAEAAPRLGLLGHDVRFFEAVGSTNDVARALAAEGAAVGTMVMASRQTAGRGRRGRSWFSPEGAGLYVSLVLEPVSGSMSPGAPPSHGLMTLGAGLALARGIGSACGIEVRIKWPNDLVLEAGPGGRRKLGGILAEGIVRNGHLDRLVLGFGINVKPAAYPVDLADVVTSVETETGGKPVRRAALLVEGLTELQRTFGQLAAGRASEVLAQWTALSPSCQGAAVQWTLDGRLRAGTTAGIDDDGALLVETEQGRERIVSADVTWI